MSHRKSRLPRKRTPKVKGSGMRDRTEFVVTNNWYKSTHFTGYTLADFMYTRNQNVNSLRETYTKSGRRDDYHTHGYRHSVVNYWSGYIKRDEGLYALEWDGLVVRDSNYPMDGHILAHREIRDWQVWVYNAAIQRYYRRLRASELQLSTDIAEMNKTKTMLRKRVDDVIGIARAARRTAIKRFFDPRYTPFDRWTERRWRGGRRKPPLPHNTLLNRDRWYATMANTWLEVRYGWQPALNSIFAIADFNRTKAKRFRVQGSYVHNVPPTRYPEAVQTDPEINGHGLYNAKYVCALRGDYYVRDAALFDKGRLSPLNPVSLAWELLPYSFVVDWFVDIGGYLQNLESSFAAGLEFMQGYETQMYVVNASANLKVSRKQLAVNSTVVTADIDGSLKDVRRRRLELTSSPVPRLPSLKPELGWKRLVSGAALLTQILTRVPKSRSDI